MTRALSHYSRLTKGDNVSHINDNCFCYKETIQWIWFVKKKLTTFYMFLYILVS